MSAVGFGAFLLVVWLLLWGSVTMANVASGLVVAAIVLFVLPATRFPIRRPTVRVVPALRFVGRVTWGLFRANAVVAREILSRESSINTGIVAVPLPYCSAGLLTLVANVLSLAPGTMAIEVTQDPASVVYVHVLHLEDVEAVRRQTLDLAALAVRGFGSAEAVAHLEELQALEHARKGDQR